MSEDSLAGLPTAYVVATATRGRTGYGICWGADGNRIEGRQIHQEEGSMCCTGGILSGVLHVLKDAEERNETKVLIYLSQFRLFEKLTEPIDMEHFGTCCKPLVKEISECKVKGVYRFPCIWYNDEGVKLASLQACLVTGTHSLAPNPINDNLYKNGVIGVAIYGDYRKTPEGEMKGAYARFFERGLLPDKDINECKWMPRVIDGGNANFCALMETFELLIKEQFREVRIKTGSKHIRDWIKQFEENPDEEDHVSRALQELHSRYKMFTRVELEFDAKDEGVLEAKKMVDEMFGSTDDGSYLKNGVPVVYTAGFMQLKGNKAVAGGGVYWGPDDPRNGLTTVPRPINNSGEFGAILTVLNAAMKDNISRLVIRTNSQTVIDNFNVNLAKWKANDWLDENGEEIEHQVYFEAVDKLIEEMESVEFEKVDSDNEGYKEANELAGYAIKSAFKGL